MSAEAEARSTIDLPGKQQELLDAVKQAVPDKPIAVVLFNGRPLTLSKVDETAPAILEAWFPGVEAGNAVADVVFGDVNPSGKLPVTFPRTLGQVPIYYNHEPTGRPCDATQKYNSRYRDLNSCDPLYEFGYGLSYTTFSVSDFSIDQSRIGPDGKVHATMTVTNTGSRAGTDVAQLYLHDPVASISQPVRRLRGFERVTLDPGQSRTIHFTVDRTDFGFYDNRGKFVVERGRSSCTPVTRRRRRCARRSPSRADRPASQPRSDHGPGHLRPGPWCCRDRGKWSSSDPIRACRGARARRLNPREPR
ncbi:glycoside hydrolase family 3 C-terminal domain-containing protein [Nocardioides ungokensis]|uniref:glycoside hydrolase family 3 C-terminal domain-containing protein n=1 Tax=Nocardioides ungokensis TaxID=1643322 RepID=UPI003CCE5149